MSVCICNTIRDLSVMNHICYLLTATANKVQHSLLYDLDGELFGTSHVDVNGSDVIFTEHTHM